MRRALFLICVCIVSICLACGGGGGGSNNALPTSSPTASSTISPSPTATPSAQVNAVIDNGAVSLSWTRPATATSLQIEREKQGEAKVVVSNPSLSTSSWVDTYAFEPNALYRYTLTAFYFSSQIASATTDWVEPNDVPTWLIMYYISADSNLSTIGKSALARLLEEGDDDEHQVVFQADFKDTTAIRGTFENSVDMGEINMADCDQLEAFLIYALSNYSAERYMLVLFDHGGQWTGYSEDYNRKPEDEIISPDDVASAIANAQSANGVGKFDIIAYECCLMAGLEPAYPLRGLCNYMIAGEPPLLGNSAVGIYGIEKTLRLIKQQPHIGAYDICVEIASRYTTTFDVGYYPSIVSVFDMSKANSAYAAFDDFAQKLAIHSNGPMANYVEIARAHRETLSPYTEVPPQDAYAEKFCVDIFDFLDKVQKWSDDAVLNASANSLREALHEFIPFSSRSAYYQRMNSGCSVFLPSRALHSQYSTEYQGGSWSVFNWDEFLTGYLNRSNSTPPSLSIITPGVRSFQQGSLSPPSYDIRISANEGGADDVLGFSYNVWHPLSYSFFRDEWILLYNGFRQTTAGDTTHTPDPFWISAGTGGNSYWIHVNDIKTESFKFRVRLKHEGAVVADKAWIQVVIDEQTEWLKPVAVFEGDMSGFYFNPFDEIEVFQYYYIDELINYNETRYASLSVNNSLENLELSIFFLPATPAELDGEIYFLPVDAFGNSPANSTVGKYRITTVSGKANANLPSAKEFLEYLNTLGIQ